MTPLPNPANYPDENALNRQIMNEDWDANQERFREAPPTKKKDVTLAERLEGVAVVIRELLGEPDFINHEELDVGDVQRALGELEEVISSLEED